MRDRFLLQKDPDFVIFLILWQKNKWRGNIAIKIIFRILIRSVFSGSVNSDAYSRPSDIKGVIQLIPVNDRSDVNGVAVNVDAADLIDGQCQP